MNTKAQHIPGPRLAICPGTNTFYIKTGDTFVARTTGDTLTDKANAEFIVRACNAHDELAEACREFVRLFSNCDSEPWWTEEHLAAYMAAKAAIAKAEGV